jgi:NADPH2:quinone reductase
MVERMQAYVRLEPQSDVVELTDLPKPSPGEGQALVEMHAFGVGIHDRYFIPPTGPFPYVIGIEGAGVVAELGGGVDNVGVGDRVIVSTNMRPEGGTWGECAVVPAGGLSPMPDAMDFATAAGVTVAGKSAVESIHSLALTEGETLFVAGASGAIGTLVVQMAAGRGVRVIGSASQPNHEYLLSLGAEAAVDYRSEGWREDVLAWAAGGVDAALAIQPGTGASSQKVVRDGGRVITVSGDQEPTERGISVVPFVHRSDTGGEMEALIDDIAEGRIRLVLEGIYPFADAIKALEGCETRSARGKRVVTLPIAE